MKNLFKNKITKKVQYWLLILIVLFFLSYTYFAIFTSDSLLSEQRGQLINVIGYLGTLFFAAIAGYFAYSQLLEIQFDRLKEQAMGSFKSKHYARAEKDFSAALAIKPYEFLVFAEYMEVLISLRDFETFDNNSYKLAKYAIDKREKLIVHYLFFARYLLQENLGFAKKHIKNTVNYYKDNSSIFVSGNWSYSDIIQTDVYGDLVGETKKIFDNYIKFITGRMNEEQKNKFITGDYILS